MRKLTYTRPPSDEIELCWRKADDLTLHAKRAIYLFRRHGSREILLIGKAYRQSLKVRWNCPSKKRFERLARKEHIKVAPLIASAFTKRHITPKLIDDIERLLIFLVQPRWNGPLKQSCTLHHRVLIVKCSGEWPYPKTEFSYCSDLPHTLFIASK
jgi:hypothetical protein